MNPFPHVDPIPLPAPVWLFKALHVVTLSLHFLAVELLLGGLLVAAWLNLRGAGGAGPTASSRRDAAASLARRLPVVMTYVINLGVPPLLFAQVLYGRALYTSSILIGAYWIAVIGLLMACYWVLYRFAAGATAGRAVWWQGLLAWVLAGAIARIYSTNMTLMLRPEVWGSMYAASPSGTHLPPPDPTLTPRWLLMLVGGFVMTGLWMVWLAGRSRSIEEPVRAYLARSGGRLALVAGIIQVLVAVWAVRAQPDEVVSGVMNRPWFQAGGYLWIAGMAAILALGGWSGFAKANRGPAAWFALGVAVATMLGFTLFRDGVRDVTLAMKGFDVWDRAVYANWTVVGLFLVLFVVGLVAVGWLISVMLRAKPVSE
ncbi:MAG: hypothetical protein D6766_08005, partial [Verrucomicrobia bacterium]